MKITKISLVSLGCMLSFMTACTSEEIVPVPDDNIPEQEIPSEGFAHQAKVSVSDFTLGTPTRTAFEIADGKGKFSWVDNDKIGIFPVKSDDATTTKSQTVFTLSKTETSGQAVFTQSGWSFTPGYDYIAHYPIVDKAEVNMAKVPVDYRNQIYTKGEKVNLSATDYMVASAKAPENERISFQFKHLGCLVELAINLPKTGTTLTEVKLSDTSESFFLTGEYDLTQGDHAIKVLTKGKDLTVKVSGVTTTADNETVKIYFMMPPTPLAGKTLTVDLTVTGAEKPSAQKVFIPVDLVAEKYYPLVLQPSDGKTLLVQKAGTLKQLLGGTKPTQLTIQGKINGDDVQVLRELAGAPASTSMDMTSRAGTVTALTHLDLSKVTIVGGGTAFNCVANTINDNMFAGCTALEALTLPESIIAIGKNILKGANALKSLIINAKPEQLKNIDPQAFSEIGSDNCQLQVTEEWKDDMTSFANGNFKNESGVAYITVDQAQHTITTTSVGWITDVHIESAVNKDPQKALKVVGPINGTDIKALREAAGCNNDVNEATTDKNTIIDLDLSGASIKASQNAYCENSTESCSYNIKQDNQIGEYMFKGSKLTTIIVPSTVTSFENRAFQECTALTSCNIPEGVKTLGESVFYNCSKLDNITLPASVESLGNNCFDECVALRSLTMEEGIKITTIPYYCFNNTLLTSFTIPNGVTTIGGGAFGYIKFGDSPFVIPAHVTSVDTKIFYQGSAKAITIEGKKTTARKFSDTMFESLLNASSCILTLDASWSSEITNGNTFKGATFKEIKQVNKPVVDIDANTHTITAHNPGSITEEHITTALGNGAALKLTGKLNDNDISTIGTYSASTKAITSLTFDNVGEYVPTATAFTSFTNSTECDLVVPDAWKGSVSIVDGKAKFGGVEWKSINTTAGVGFGGVTDQNL